MTSGILCDYEIETAHAVGDVVIKPFRPENIQPNSYDVSLGKEIWVMYPTEDQKPKKVKLPYVIKHGEFVLGTTEEILHIKRNCCVELTGKSTPARHGIEVHLTAGFVDCGFNGNVTLEIVNNGYDYELKAGMLIGQFVFHHSQTPRLPYGERNNHYQNQEGPTLPHDLVPIKSSAIKEFAKKQRGKK